MDDDGDYEDQSNGNEEENDNGDEELMADDDSAINNGPHENPNPSTNSPTAGQFPMTSYGPGGNYLQLLQITPIIGSNYCKLLLITP
jgi:hypothetical protein